MEKTIQKKRQNNKNNHNALEKARAVLSLWTERRKGSEICKELNIQWGILQMWSNRAMEGMLQALEPRVNLAQGPALSPRLQQMLERKKRTLVKPGMQETRLEEKLVKIEAKRTDKKEKKAKK